VSADGKMDMTTEMIDVGKQCHDSCSISATTKVHHAIANKNDSLSVGH